MRGEAAGVNTMHEITDAGAVDTRLWISKRRGLVLREDITTDVGGAAGTSQMSMRFEYGNVKAPPGVQ